MLYLYSSYTPGFPTCPSQIAPAPPPARRASAQRHHGRRAAWHPRDPRATPGTRSTAVSQVRSVI